MIQMSSCHAKALNCQGVGL